MKAILVIDTPLKYPEDIYEYGMIADLQIRPTTMTDKDELFYEVKNCYLKPFPEKIIIGGNYGEFTEYDKGYNDAIDEILGEEE